MLALLLLACAPDDVSELLDYEPVIEVVMQPEIDGQSEVAELEWTVEGRRDVEIVWTAGQDVTEHGDAAVTLQETSTLIGRGDVVSVPLAVAVSPESESQMFELPFVAFRCRWFGEECDRSPVDGSLLVAVEVEPIPAE